MSGAVYFVIVGAQDSPVYEYELSGRGSSESQYRVSDELRFSFESL